ncbi:carotenoid oxygenase family protein [Corallococcus sp. BB11-1]|uniref:carotenoid oxygenase family protein n=1 Tax=Corallococcus sp. BB11-1 TaxID=2996783 RepID=UPI00226EE73A|nr:carotenoid oxygenase family protein [Corallococcus sp. BB11-1]MCY1033747.1 carotenoid oxygenase family protein [Corallococcus sp. BB11-1]
MTTAMKQTTSSPAPGWHRAFRTLPRQHGFEPLRVEGQVPEGLRGSLYRVGPWTFEVHGQPYQHWFDGDGGMLGVRFGPEGVTGAARLLDTPGMVAERAAKAPRYGAYGTPTPLWHKLRNAQKNSANTSVMAWNGKLYALFEADKPVEVSMDDLSTVGESDLEGVVVGSFSAHPHRVPSRKTSYNFGIQYGRETTAELYALPDGGKARRMGAVTLPGATMVHDFIATDRYLVFFLAPLRLNIFRMLLRLGSYSDNLRWKPDAGTQVLVVPIDDVAHPVRIPAEAFYLWHFANAHEQGDTLVVDYVHYPDFTTNQWLGDLMRGGTELEARGRLHRAMVDVKAGTFRTERLSDVSCEFPRVAPGVVGRAHQTLYLGGHSTQEARRGLFDSVMRYDVGTGRMTQAVMGEGQYPSEPVFVPRPGASAEDDGWVLTQVYDAKADASHVAVLDARRLEDGPVARCHFDHALPPTFHGGFAPA